MVMRDVSIAADNYEMNYDDPPWAVEYTGKAVKQKGDLPPDIDNALLALVKALQWHGPVQKKRPHYGKIKGLKKNTDIHHCHLNKGHPTYVVAWKVADKKGKKMEIIHVGTNEKTDYRRLG